MGEHCIPADLLNIRAHTRARRAQRAALHAAQCRHALVGLRLQVPAALQLLNVPLPQSIRGRVLPRRRRVAVRREPAHETRLQRAVAVDESCGHEPAAAGEEVVHDGGAVRPLQRREARAHAEVFRGEQRGLEVARGLELGNKRRLQVCMRG